MTTGAQEITVKAAIFPHQRRTVLYACSPSGYETMTGRRAGRTADQIHLVSILRGQLGGVGNSLWADCRYPQRAELPIRVVHDPLGRPRLLLGEFEGPAVSFSESGGRIWAALSGDASDIGIDAAGADEFPMDYPHHRVFHVQELQQALGLASGELKKASAMLWSIKEAAVKALGCAFHHVDPRHLRVFRSGAGNDGWHDFAVDLSRQALERCPMPVGRHLWVRSLLQDETWLSIALLEEQGDRTVHGRGEV